MPNLYDKKSNNFTIYRYTDITDIKSTNLTLVKWKIKNLRYFKLQIYNYCRFKNLLYSMLRQIENSRN